MATTVMSFAVSDAEAQSALEALGARAKGVGLLELAWAERGLATLGTGASREVALAAGMGRPPMMAAALGVLVRLGVAKRCKGGWTLTGNRSVR